MTTAPFARGFRLHLWHGQALDGAELPNGRAFVMDDPMWGLGSTARTVDLLQAGYPDARIEWPDEQLHDRLTELVTRWRAEGPPCGSSVSRWWDQHLAELAAVIDPADDKGQEADGG
ncbi:hypothetical protein AB0L68_36440 [Streptomyces sp. NPDC052164]|uniref:hypothetical protein n=1 Tax=Streptomyces sp. NPDC052164 TaxID=3155529 RepID=UPI00341C5D64